ncbi:MAG TPA: AMP-binding protein [Phenylobacterium sp.]|uniref:AMP-binding protein n=1 Tax=Phenylobacterium sp. TaxID=1871053 RepID=UPI002B4AA24A|nr:AMP-binding protein [Phenylobacterium sp.]HKR87134.1 AMP-binding protein [Phenylobacterium sp.]
MCAARLNVTATHRDDGTILLQSEGELPETTSTIPQRLSHWARETPDAPFLSETDRLITYAQAEAARRRLSAGLAALRLPPDRPLMILGENGIDHALLMLAATAIGIPVAVVSPAYAAASSAPWDKLGRVVGGLDPACLFADDAPAAEEILAAVGHAVPVRPLRDLAWLEAAAPVDPVVLAAAEAAVAPDTVAKLLFTSGSTGSPKAVVNTQRMMVSNMAALAMVWPFLNEAPPVLVDWLPWNHTFGGNCCFNIALWFGGHLHVDRGRPTATSIGRSVEAIRRYRPTLYFNVPIGYEVLLPILERDADFAADFLGRLKFIFNAGAPMPASLRARLEAVSRAATGRRANVVGGWGATETAPFSTVLCFPTEHAANLGAPIPGTTIKLVPDGGRYELRVRGPNVTPGYWKDPAATAAAFDDEGFYRIGDAGKFADPNQPAAGIVFDGRVAENFKLASGTFVNVGALRLAVISASEKLVSDAVIAGEGRCELGLLLFTSETACRTFLGQAVCAELGGAPAGTHPAVIERLTTLLRAYNATATGSSTRIARFLVLDEPPSAAHDEITDKGYINQRRVLARRGVLVDQLFEAGHVV